MGHEDHVQMLLRQAAELGPGPRAAALKREAAELLGEDDPRTLALLKEAFAEDPGDLGEQLQAMAAVTESWALLVEVCQQGLERISDVEARIERLKWLGMYQEELLGDVAAATASWQRVLELDPGHAVARRTVERLSRVEAPVETPRIDRETMERLTAGSPFRGPVPRPARPPVEAPPAAAPSPVAPPARGNAARVAVLIAVALAAVLATVLWLSR